MTTKELWIALLLMAGYGALVAMKVTDASGLVVLLTYMVKKLMDIHGEKGDSNVQSNSTMVQESIQQSKTTGV